MKKRTVLYMMICCVSLDAAWFKGNTHAHSVNSDGQQAPGQVLQWYKDHGYSFMAVTDHNYFNPAEYAGFISTYGTPNFLVMSGEEVTDGSSDRGAIHIVGLNINTIVNPHGTGTSTEVISSDVAGITAAGGIAIYAHPAYGCCAAANDFLAVPSLKFLEVNNPAATSPIDSIWDSILSNVGRPIYGLGVDDEHNLISGWALPGQSWIVVRAQSLSIANILAAMQNGDFYASSGVELSDIQVTPTSYSVIVNPIAGHSYLIEFFGKDGTSLLQSNATSATYTFTGTELYVRSKVSDLTLGWGFYAWTQPTFLTSVTPSNVSLSAGGSQKFSATVRGTSTTAVTWSISPSVGTINPAGMYKAPASIAVQSTVTITATSTAVPASKGTATVTLLKSDKSSSAH